MVSTRNICCYPEEKWISHFSKEYRGSINEHLGTMPTFRIGHTSWHVPSLPIATLPITHGTLPVGSVILKGTRKYKTEGLTYIPDSQSVDASCSFPPAPHSGEGPVIEAIRIPGKEQSRTHGWPGMDSDPYPRNMEGTISIWEGAIPLLGSRGVRNLCPCV